MLHPKARRCRHAHRLFVERVVRERRTIRRAAAAGRFSMRTGYKSRSLRTLAIVQRLPAGRFPRGNHEVSQSIFARGIRVRTTRGRGGAWRWRRAGPSPSRGRSSSLGSRHRPSKLETAETALLPLFAALCRSLQCATRKIASFLSVGTVFEPEGLGFESLPARH